MDAIRFEPLVIPMHPQISPNPALKTSLLRVATAASHRGPSREELEAALDAALQPVMAAGGRKRPGPGAIFAASSSFARTIRRVQGEIDSYIGRADILAGRSGRFDARSLGCWLAIAEKAAVAAVPAKPIMEIPEPVLELMLDPETASAPATKPGIVFKTLNAISGGSLEKAFGRLSRLAPETKTRLLEMGLAHSRAAGEEIPAGHMVRHDHMGPGTLKAWAGIGWEPWSGDDGVVFEHEDGGRITLGPGWAAIGNSRIVDIHDSRTAMAIAQACVDTHVFWARPWKKPARRYGGLDIHRPESWAIEDRQGSWPAEWRVFIRGGKAVAVTSYYPWAEIPGDAEDQAMAETAMAKAQAMADWASAAGIIPADPKLSAAWRVSAEARRMLPEGTMNATLDFIETDEGLLFLEGAMACGPGGYGAHPCAFAGHRWPEGIKFRLDDGINIAEPDTWPEEARRGFGD